MAYETLNEINTSEGLHTIFTYVGGVVPIFYPMLLLALFIVSTAGSYFISVRYGRVGDFPASFASGSFLTAVVATFMSLIPLINLPTLVTTYALAIIGAIWLYFSRD